jgi:acyl carrier protein
MKPVREETLVGLVKAWIKQNGQNPGSPEITENTDLIASGFLDSFGFIELIMFMESKTGCKIDLSDIEPSEFTVVKKLCKHAIRKLPQKGPIYVE